MPVAAAPARRLRLAAALAAVVAAGCGPGRPPASPSSGARTETPAPSHRQLPQPPAAALPEGLALGQMFAVSFSGREVTPALRHLIVDDKVGTVLLFPSNFSGVADLTRLVGELQAAGREAGLPAPLLITTDEEGGAARTVTDGVPPLPDARSLGHGGAAAVRAQTGDMARALHDLNIRLDLAPVADLRTNPADAAVGNRAFGSTADVVGPLVSAYVDGLHDGGVGATLKHFPGLGGAAGDPHRHIPTDATTLAAWRANQRATFAAGLQAGADAVMTTAVTVPGLDPAGTPAVFSVPVVQGLLRSELRFDGVIVTDSLSLGGIGERYPLPGAAVAAATAGNDLLLLSNGDPTYEADAIGAVRAAVDAGSIPLAQVERSAARVVALSTRWGS